MTTQVVSRDLLMPQDPGGSRRGIALSVLVHIGLVVAIAFGLNWRSHEPEAQQAELWAAVPQAAAAREVEPIVQPPPPTPPVPAPVVQPEPKAVEPPKPEPVPDAQIAIEQARKEDGAQGAGLGERSARTNWLPNAKRRRRSWRSRKRRRRRRRKRPRRPSGSVSRNRMRRRRSLQQALEAQQAKQREAGARRPIETNPRYGRRERRRPVQPAPRCARPGRRQATRGASGRA